MTTNILSIDWDYFIDISKNDKVLYFPDGGEYVSPLMNKIWVERYVLENKDKMEKVYIEKDKVDILVNWLKKIESQLKNTELHIALGHQDIAGLVMNKVDLKDDLNIINIDDHHDNYGNKEVIDEKQVNCGNWVNFLENRGYNLKIDWIPREDSDFDKEKLNKIITPTLEYEKFKDKIPDYIFLCKSPGYSPPHLDVEFINLLSKIFKYVKDSYMFTREVINDRYKKIKKMAKEREKELEDLGLANI